MYVIVWEFQVRIGSEGEFERLYGPGGEWSRLFGRADGFLGLELLREGSGGGRYLVVDRWASKGAFEGFRDHFLQDYEALDRRCDPLLEHETPIGGFLGLGRSRE
jgi:heme-degrading monooxygenase HmoA